MRLAYETFNDGVALLNGLKGYWKLDENTTTGTCYDATTNHFDLSVFNTLDFSTNGLNGSALISAVDGDEGLYSTGTNAATALAFSGNWSISCWVRRGETYWGADNIFTKAAEIYFLWDMGDDKLHLVVLDGRPIGQHYLIMPLTARCLRMNGTISFCDEMVIK